MSRVLAVANQKGGVGKTTTACNLAAALVRSGHRALVVDMDPQAHATHHLLGPEENIDKTIADVLLGRATAVDVHRATSTDGLEVLPAEIELASADLQLGGVVGKEFKLRDALDPLLDAYDDIIIDAPPSLGLLTINSLVAADAVLVTVQAELMGLRGTRELMETIKVVRQYYNARLQLDGVLVCMYDSRRRLSAEVVQTLQQTFGDKLLQTRIRRTVGLAEAGGIGKTIFDHDPSGAGAVDYAALSGELLRRRGNGS